MIYNQMVTWTAFAILAMFIYISFFEVEEPFLYLFLFLRLRNLFLYFFIFLFEVEEPGKAEDRHGPKLQAATW